jgi:hypothetical protein
VAWLRLKEDDRKVCQECFQEAIDKNIPALKRIGYIEEYPCSKHGAPYFLPPKLTAWVEFFFVIQPYCTLQTLPVDLIDKICTEYGISFCKAFEMLTIILRAMTKQHERSDQSNGIQGSAEIPEE